MTPRLTHAEITRIRDEPGRSMLLFITDRCPVGCLHCSVDSRRDSPSIDDFELFGEIVGWLCEQPALEVVGISGGEPFVERRGLEIATQGFARAGKRQVIFTSGVWAVSPEPPAWIAEALSNVDTIYLSTDTFHTPGVDSGRFLQAARTIAAAGCWIVVQVLDFANAPTHAEAQLRLALGEGWREFAELNLTMPLRYGRGASQFPPIEGVPGQAFGRCRFVASPTVRYDGLVTGCCNESLIMNRGPQRLRQHAGSKSELASALAAFRGDSLLQVMERHGPGVVTADARFADLAERTFGSICELCWAVCERLPEAREPDRMLTAIAAEGAVR